MSKKFVPKNKEMGEIAMELIAGYPLYASTSGLTHEEAVSIAHVLFGPDLVAAKAENENLEGLSPKEGRTNAKH